MQIIREKTGNKPLFNKAVDLKDAKIIPVRVSANVMVRNEAETICSVLFSIMPLAKEILVDDTGSTDGTLEILRMLASRFPQIKLTEHSLPDCTQWGLDNRIEPNIEVGAVRGLQQRKSKYPIIWIVDGDEVYTKATLSKMADFIRNWPEGYVCGLIPLLWMTDYLTMATKAHWPTYPATGRLFLRDSITILGTFPNEYAKVDDEILNMFHPKAVVLDCPPMIHYEMMTKPWRRNALEFVNLYEAAMRREGICV